MSNRVGKKISTPFLDIGPDAAIILINAVDMQLNTVKAFIETCKHNDMSYILLLSKTDLFSDNQVQEKLMKIKTELCKTVIDIGITHNDKHNIEHVEHFLKENSGKKIILLGVFNAGKTTLLNTLCDTNYETDDIPGTTVNFTMVPYYNNTMLIDSVGQLIDLDKPMMVSIDLSNLNYTSNKIQRVFTEEVIGLHNTRKLVVEPILRAIQILSETVNSGGKIIVTGAGASALVAKEIAGQGTECGFPVMVFTNDMAEAQPISFSKGVAEEEAGLARYASLCVDKKDVVIGISASGGTGFVYELLRISKKKGTKTISITENKDGRLAKYSDVIIKSDAKPEGPSSSKIQTAHLVIGHTLMIILADKFNVTADQSIQNMLTERVKTKKMGIK